MTISKHLAHTLQSGSMKRAMAPATPKDPTMSATSADAATPIWAREDTMLGVCHGVGEELGIHANWLRVALLLALFWNPVAVVVGYLAVGIALAALRWAKPLHPPVAAPQATAPALRGDNDDGAVPQADAA